VKQHITAHSIANEVRMTRSLHKGTFLLVEGGTDARVFKRFVDKANCKVIPANGKDKALDALKILEDDNFKGALVIVDADFWHLEGIKPGSANLLFTDTHDLETMILSAPEVLEKLQSEFGHDKKMKLLPKPVVDLVLDCSLPIGFLRWWGESSTDAPPIRFRELTFENFIDKAKLTVNINQLIEEIKNNLRDVEIDEKAIKDKIRSFKKENHDPWQVCCGHDMVHVLAIGFRSVFGNKNVSTWTAAQLEGTLRVSYEYSHFRLTRLHGSIEEWQTLNPSFKVLP